MSSPFQELIALNGREEFPRRSPGRLRGHCVTRAVHRPDRVGFACRLVRSLQTVERKFPLRSRSSGQRRPRRRTWSFRTRAATCGQSPGLSCWPASWVTLRSTRHPPLSATWQAVAQCLHKVLSGQPYGPDRHKYLLDISRQVRYLFCVLLLSVQTL